MAELKEYTTKELKDLLARQKAATELPTPENMSNPDAEVRKPEGIPVELDASPEDDGEAEKLATEPTSGDDESEFEKDSVPEQGAVKPEDDESDGEDLQAEEQDNVGKEADAANNPPALAAAPAAQSEALAAQLTQQEQGVAAASPQASPQLGAAAPKPGTSEYYSDLMNRFKAAQQQGNVNQSLNDMGKYGYAATLGMRGVQRNPMIEKAMEEEGQRAQQPVQQFMQQLQVQGQDPNSPAAMAMRSALADALHIDPSKLAGMSGDQMEKFSSTMGTLFHTQVMSNAAMMGAKTKQQNADTGKQKADQQEQQIKNQAPLIVARTGAANAQADYLKGKPALEQKKLDIMQSKAEKAILDKGNKADTDLGNAVNNFRGNMPVQKASEALRNSDSAMALITRYPNLDDMPTKDYNLLTAEMAKIATGGATTEAAAKDIRAQTLLSRAAGFWSAVGGTPTRAQLGEFIQNNKEYLQSLNTINHKYVDDFREDKLLAARGATPEYRQFLANKHLPGRELDFANFSSKSKQTDQSSQYPRQVKKQDGTTATVSSEQEAKEAKVEGFN